jgi:hypothetical protein
MPAPEAWRCGGYENPRGILLLDGGFEPTASFDLGRPALSPIPLSQLGVGSLGGGGDCWNAGSWLYGAGGKVPEEGVRMERLGRSRGRSGLGAGPDPGPGQMYKSEGNPEEGLDGLTVCGGDLVVRYHLCEIHNFLPVLM